MLVAFGVLLALSGCYDLTPSKEDVPELITKATLTFTPLAGGSDVVVTATDPDGEGVANIAVDGSIDLKTGETYVLKIQMINALADKTSPDYDLTSQVETEGEEHMFFFGWTDGLFANPAGDGNIDRREDQVNYTGGSNSIDANGRPLGLTTTWTSSAAAGTGTFRLLLKHQPGLKSDTSDSSMGESDLDITFDVHIE